MIDFLTWLVSLDTETLRTELGDLFVPTVATVVATGAIVALGAVAQLFVNTFVVLLNLKGGNR